MRNRTREIFTRVMVCTLAIMIPALFIAYGFQTKRYADLSREISVLEKKQEELIEQNKKLVSDISLLSSADRIEKIASSELGMHKAETEDIVRVELNGDNND